MAETKKEREQREAREALEAQRVADLAELGLTPDDTVRFPKSETSNRHIEGRPINVNRDGSIGVIERHIRAKRPEDLEVKRRGPRGGVVWVPVIQRRRTTPDRDE